MNLPEELRAELERAIGTRILRAEPLEGGMVARAARVETADGPIFVKWKDDSPLRFFEMEADGLNRIGATGALRTPKVLAWQDVSPGRFPFLALAWIDTTGPSPGESLDQRLGEGLARLHRTRSPFATFGLDADNFLGSQPQRNSQTTTWTDFYRDCRIVPQMEVARRRGFLSPNRERRLDKLLERFDAILGEHCPTPVLIHGDLWAGNLIRVGDDPVVIDPAVYYADREMEIAYMQLFSGFAPEVFRAYEASYPLDPDYVFRRPLHQLYPLLIHLNHFGERYGHDVDDVCRFYLGVP